MMVCSCTGQREGGKHVPMGRLGLGAAEGVTGQGEGRAGKGRGGGGYMRLGADHATIYLMHL